MSVTCDLCRRKLLTKAKVVYGVSFGAPPAAITGAVVTLGPTVDRNAGTVISWCIPTIRGPWINLVSKICVQLSI